MTNYSKCFHEIPYEDVDNISKKIYQYILDKIPLENIKSFQKIDIQDLLYNVPLFKNAVCFLNFEVKDGYIVLLRPGWNNNLHIDFNYDKLRVLFPVYNCADSTTIFYDVPDEDKIFKFISGIPIYKPIGTSYPKLCEFKLNTFTVFNTQVAHSIIRTNLNNYRISLTWSCKNSLEKYLI